MSRPFARLWFAALAVMLTASLYGPALAQKPVRPIGGPCSYEEHPGTATIVSVTALPRTSSEAYQPHRILFTFQAEPMIADPLYAPGKVHEMTLTGGAAPGAKFVEKYGITQGRKIPASIRLIRGGTCTPVLFKFQGIDLSDRVGMQGPLP